MIRRTLTALLLCCTAVAADDDLATMKVDKIFQTLCATCHGQELEGGLGGSLIDGKWNHGASDEDLFRSIAKGNPELGMTPWEGVLTKEQIRSMVIFLREKETEAERKVTVFPVPSPDTVTSTTHHDYRLETVVAEGLTIPWAIAFLPDGRRLVAERPGGLRVIDADGHLLPEPVRDTPAVMHYGQGGMMEVAPHPDFANNGWIYLGISDGWRDSDDEKAKPNCLTAVVRGRIRDHQWINQEWIYRADRKFYSKAGQHFGTRFVFDDGYIYFVIGERGGMLEAQDLTRPNGKIFRLHDDGRVPADNPFTELPGALPGIWSFGHRNPQGLDQEPGTGDLYSTEHGPRGGDELNRIRRGANYGWPIITYGMNYNGTPMTAETSRDGMEQPIIHWTPSIAVCGLDFYRGDRFPNWKNDLFAGALKQQEVRRLRIRDRKVVEQEIILKNIGRVRDVAGGPDGYLYVLLNEPDRIIRLVPAS